METKKRFVSTKASKRDFMKYKKIEQIHPFGVDVSSGVEQDHGIKDLNKVSAFIEGARSV